MGTTKPRQLHQFLDEGVWFVPPEDMSPEVALHLRFFSTCWWTCLQPLGHGNTFHHLAHLKATYRKWEAPALHEPQHPLFILIEHLSSLPLRSNSWWWHDGECAAVMSEPDVPQDRPGSFGVRFYWVSATLKNLSGPHLGQKVAPLLTGKSLHWGHNRWVIQDI